MKLKLERSAKPAPLIATQFYEAAAEVSPNNRFLMIRLAGEETSPPVRVVLNWFQELKSAFR